MRNALIAVGLVALVLLALGALPSYLGSGQQYYLEVSATDDTGTAVDVGNISERRYPYLTTALAADDGRSEGYQRGLGGFKDAFTHTPFDEHSALQQLEPGAARDDGDRVIVQLDEERYSVAIVDESGATQ
jgi:hypothetical protein